MFLFYFYFFKNHKNIPNVAFGLVCLIVWWFFSSSFFFLGGGAGVIFSFEWLCLSYSTNPSLTNDGTGRGRGRKQLKNSPSVTKFTFYN